MNLKLALYACQSWLRYVSMAVTCWTVMPIASASPLTYLRAALDHSSEYQQAQTNLEIATESINVARAALLPQVRSGFNYRLDRPPAMGGSPDRLNGQITASQELFNLVSSANVEIADLQFAVTKLRIEETRQRILLVTYRAYLQAALAHENLTLLDRRRATLVEQLKIATNSLEVGQANRVQLLNVQAQLAALAVERISAKHALTSAFNNLENLTGRPATDILALARPPTIPLGSPDWWRTQAANSPTIAAAAVDIQVQQATTRQLIGQALPSLIFEGVADQDLDTTYSLNLSIPIFSSGGATAAKRRSQLQEQGLQAARQALLDARELEVTEAYRSYIEHRAREVALQASVAVERERLALAQASVELSSGILADALNAATDLAAAELMLAQARHAQMESWLTLLAATGGLTVQAAQELEELFE